MKKVILFFAIVLATAVWLTGCGGEEPEAATDTPAAATPTAAISATPMIREANVDSIEVVILESFPVQVNVRARGEFPDGCTMINDISTTRDGTAFMVTITTVRQAEDVCTEALVPFEETIPLDVVDLPAGNYTVSVNGINGSFTLAVDNTADAAPQPTETPTAEPEDANNAIINGRVWHDLCAVAGGEGDEPAVPSEGCIAATDGETFQANGLLDEGEPGLEGVQVSLGEGECPASGVTTATTDEDGDYVFTDLSAGTYCVSVDPTAAENELLLPGQFTFPGLDEGSLTVTLAEGEVLTDVNFGWDYEFLPVPDVDLANCSNIRSSRREQSSKKPGGCAITAPVPGPPNTA